jgi:uncharacterized protein (DUF2249 family)
MVISANTKIAAILKHDPAALDAIVSLSPKFEKLRNPLLRKLMAGRTSVSMASRIGGCGVSEFLEKLKPLGFDIDSTAPAAAVEKAEAPAFIQSLRPEQVVVLDVRPILAEGKDPLNLILKSIKDLHEGEVLKIQNSFEPTPLMQLLKKQGFESYADVVNENLVETYFYRKSFQTKWEAPVVDASKNWDEVLQRFDGKCETIDVRALEMPLPMLTILEALNHLPGEKALYVYHKRIPVFLLPELAQRAFDYRIKEIGEGDVHLLIFRK